MEPYTPEEILELLESIIDSLTDREETYECVDMAVKLRDELLSIW